MDEVKLSKKFLKNNELKDNSTRLAQYFNSELVMIKDSGQWGQLNSKILNKGKSFHSGVFRTHKVLIIGMLFAKHTSYE